MKKYDRDKSSKHLKEEMNSSKRDDFTVYSLLKVMKNEHSN
jgi:hypothetical protein